MNIIVNILLIIFVPVCILLILMVLLQAGKGGGLSGAFGGMGTAQPFLGARGTVDFLSKLTIYLAIGFMALSLVLSVSYGPSRTIKVKDAVPIETQGGNAPGANPLAKPAGKAPISSITIPAGKPTPVQKTTGTSGSTQTPASTPSGK